MLCPASVSSSYQGVETQTLRDPGNMRIPWEFAVEEKAIIPTNSSHCNAEENRFPRSRSMPRTVFSGGEGRQANAKAMATEPSTRMRKPLRMSRAHVPVGQKTCRQAHRLRTIEEQDPGWRTQNMRRNKYASIHAAATSYSTMEFRTLTAIRVVNAGKFQRRWRFRRTRAIRRCVRLSRPPRITK